MRSRNFLPIQFFPHCSTDLLIVFVVESYRAEVANVTEERYCILPCGRNYAKIMSNVLLGM
jgi:hypothetical protein